MVKQELIDRSPVRFFEKSLNGGVKAGEIGVIASKKGLGKTSVLVQIGLDMLLQDKQVVHVSFNQHSDYVISWYEDIFAEMAKKKNLDKAGEIKDELIRKRIVLNFNQDIVSLPQIIKTMTALKESGINAEGIIIDGFDFSRASADDFAQMKHFAEDARIAVWISCNTEGSDLKSMFPACVESASDCFAVIIFLEPNPDSIQMKVLKEHSGTPHDINIKLDTKTLLMAER